MNGNDPLGGSPPGGLQRKRLRVPVDLDNLEEIKCLKCGNKLFVDAYFLKFMSKLVSPEGQPGYMAIQVFKCTACGRAMPTAEEYAGMKEVKH